ncbi:MAG: BON domain-containing protein [Thermodesulfobacteriota bacterium]
MQKQRQFWHTCLAVGASILVVPAVVQGQSRGTGPFGASSGYHSGSGATGHHGTSGTTDTPHSLTEAEERAEGERPHGRTAIENDAVILSRVQESIRTDPALASSAQGVTVAVENGVVTLRGPVKTEKEKADLAAKAQQVAGVREVNNQLQTAPNLGGTTGGSEPQEHQTDSLLDQGSLPTPADASVSSRPVLIPEAHAEESFPPTEGRGAAATDDPQETGSGSMHEADRTGTTGPSGSMNAAVDSGPVDPQARLAKPAGDYAVTNVDRDLVARVRLALTDPQLPVSEDNIHIVADNGEITLFGAVPTEQAKEAIAEKARAQRGVQGVDNRIRVVGGGSVSSTR